MNIAESAFRSLETIDPRPTALVVGTGFGGLAAAIRLGAKGYRVHMLEKLDAPGGRAYVYRQDGFTFDAGPTIVTAPFLLEELWAMCGKRFADDVELKPMDPFSGSVLTTADSLTTPATKRITLNKSRPTTKLMLKATSVT